MTRGVDHELECALAAYGVLIERAEQTHGVNSIEAKNLRRELQQMIKRKRG
jgi:hypothetical protein